MDNKGDSGPRRRWGGGVDGGAAIAVLFSVATQQKRSKSTTGRKHNGSSPTKPPEPTATAIKVREATTTDNKVFVVFAP